jgi:hypothetical protein
MKITRKTNKSLTAWDYVGIGQTFVERPGDLVRIVHSSEAKIDDDILGQTGVIVEPVTLEDGHPINSWCDWWVLIDGEMQPWAEENLQLVNDGTDDYDSDKENQ